IPPMVAQTMSDTSRFDLTPLLVPPVAAGDVQQEGFGVWAQNCVFVRDSWVSAFTQSVMTPAVHFGTQKEQVDVVWVSSAVTWQVVSAWVAGAPVFGLSTYTRMSVNRPPRALPAGLVVDSESVYRPAFSGTVWLKVVHGFGPPDDVTGGGVVVS